MSWITTATSKKFYFDKPQFDITDIAHALSNECRFSGHTRIYFSVAQHCVHVARYLRRFDRRTQLAGLMHDASEAYLKDIPRPLKKQLQPYRDMEERYEALLAEQYGYDFPYPPAVKWADEVAFSTEVRDLFRLPLKEWGLKYQPARERIRPWTPSESEYRFLDTFSELY